ESGMKETLLCCTLLLLISFPCSAQSSGRSSAQGEARNTPQATAAPPPDVVRIEAQPQKGFLYPYYLYVPSELRAEKSGNAKQTILVVPNNTGKTDDDLAVHEASAKRLAEGRRNFASNLKVVLLVPV